MCMNKSTEQIRSHAELGLSDNQILSLPCPIGIVWQPNNDHSLMGIRHINWTSMQQIHAESIGYWWVPRQSILRYSCGSSESWLRSKLNQFHCIPNNPLDIQLFGHLSVFAHWWLISFQELVWWNRIEFAQIPISSQWSDLVIQSGSDCDSSSW